MTARRTGVEDAPCDMHVGRDALYPSRGRIPPGSGVMGFFAERLNEYSAPDKKRHKSPYYCCISTSLNRSIEEESLRQLHKSGVSRDVALPK